MSTTLCTRTVCCKLAVDTAADAALVATAQAFNAAASYCATVAWQQHVTNKNKLHPLVYAETRVTYGLGVVHHYIVSLLLQFTASWCGIRD